jgi:hypothetical protein
VWPLSMELVTIDPELERRARRLFSELKHKPLVEPTRDLTRAVLERIRKLNDTPGKLRDNDA